jgi:hypothetical protein
MVMPYRQDNEEPTVFIRMIKLIVSWAGALLSIVILIILIIWGFSLNVSDNAEIPVVKAKIKDFRVVSEEPGGQIVNYQGLSVNNVQEQGSAQSTAIRIILAPEPIKLIEKDVNISIVEDSEPTSESPVPALNNNNVDEENIKEIISTLEEISSLAVIISIVPTIRKFYRNQSLDKIIEINEVGLKSGANLVQLGFYSTKQEARKAWSDLMINNSSIFKNKKRIIQNANIGGNSSYRLTVIGFSSLGESRNFCLLFREVLQTCLPMRAK